MKTVREIRAAIDNGEYDSEYAEYIMEHGDSSVCMVCNGDTLIRAVEQGYLFEEFTEEMIIRLSEEV